MSCNGPSLHSLPPLITFKVTWCPSSNIAPVDLITLHTLILVQMTFKKKPVNCQVIKVTRVYYVLCFGTNIQQMIKPQQSVQFKILNLDP